MKASGYARFQRNEARLRAAHGFDVASFLAQMTGSAAVSSDTHTTMFRAALGDPATAQSEFATLAQQPALVFSSRNARVRPVGGGFYRETNGTNQTTFGISRGQFLAGRASVDQLSAFAAAPGRAAAGAQGSIAFRIALADLLRVALTKAPSGLAQVLLAQLGDVTGWAQASPAALTGSASLAIK